MKKEKEKEKENDKDKDKDKDKEKDEKERKIDKAKEKKTEESRKELEEEKERSKSTTLRQIKLPSLGEGVDLAVVARSLLATNLIQQAQNRDATLQTDEERALVLDLSQPTNAPTLLETYQEGLETGSQFDATSQPNTVSPDIREQS